MAWECVGEEVKRGGQCIYSGNAFVSRKPRNTHTVLIAMTEHKTVQVSYVPTPRVENSFLLGHSSTVTGFEGKGVLVSLTQQRKENDRMKDRPPREARQENSGVL